MRLQPTTYLVETTGLVEQKTLTVFSTITVVDCTLCNTETRIKGLRLVYLCWVSRVNSAASSRGYGDSPVELVWRLVVTASVCQGPTTDVDLGVTLVQKGNTLRALLEGLDLDITRSGVIRHLKQKK